MNTTTPSRPVGDRPLSLSRHLRAAVDLLLDEARTTYDWNKWGQCNCGAIVRTITGLSAERVLEMGRVKANKLLKEKGYWLVGWTQFADRERCPVSGMAIDDLVDQLLAAGFESDDFKHVEWLWHPELNHPDWKQNDGHHGNRANAAYYLARWADAIEAFHAAARPAEIVDQAAMSLAADTPVKQDLLTAHV